MPHGNEFGFQEEVKANGTKLAGPSITSWYVDQSLTLPDLAVVRFSDPEGKVAGNPELRIGTAFTLGIKSSQQSVPEPLFSGEITAVEIEFGDDGSSTTVRGMDLSHRLLRGTTVETYVDMTAGDIARKVAQRAGLQVGNVDAGGTVYKHVAQDARSDWEFLQLLARQSGCVVSMDGEKFNFSKPTESATAPASGNGSPEVLEKGANLIALRAAVTASDQAPEVEVRGWDMKAKAAVVGTARAGSKTAEGTGTDPYTPASLANLARSSKYVVPSALLDASKACGNYAAAVSARLSGAFAELDGTVRGNAKLKAGTAVTIRNCGGTFDGKYTLTTVRHEKSAHTGYVTHFGVSSTSDRSLFSTASGVGAGQAAEFRSGVLSAVVTDVADPDQLGRVKVKIPVLSDQFESWWARTVQPGAGAGRGLVVLPEVGDEVLVAFAQGSLMQPFIIGGLYNGQDKPDKAWSEHVDRNAGTVTRRAFTSRTGMLVEFLEASGEEKLTISSSGGKQRITLVQTGAGGIEIEAQGAVSVTATKDITVSADSGTLSLKGNKVSVEAATELSLKGATVKVEAQSALEAKGATVKVAGSGMLEVSSSGVTTVKGSLVKIN